MHPELYRAAVLRKALELYVRTGIKPNSAYTPKAMLLTATHITGRPYKQRQYALAIADLSLYLEQHA